MSINAGSIIASLDLDTGKFSTKLGQAQAQADGFAGKLRGYGGAFEDLGKGLTLGVTVPIVGLGIAAAKTAIDFESAFAGVKKTVDATDEQFEKLEAGIRDMTKEIPASAVAISEVAEAAGQLGIETDNILSFSRVMIDLGEATNLSANDAATALARFANITQMSQQDFDKLGSVIVDLGNNLATTESEIVNMGLRLAGAGKQIGLSEAEIMSFAGSLSSVGIEAEAGGSAFSKLMVNMQLASETGTTANDVIKTTGKSLRDLQMLADADGKSFKALAQSLGLTSTELKGYMSTATDLNAFAKVTGKTAEEFAKAFSEDATGAIKDFIGGLATAEERGMSAIAVLDEMGITELRLRDALLRAAGAGDVFTESIKIGTNAWEENNALTKEAEQRYKTTASQIEIAKNYLKDAGITMGEIVVPYVVSLAEGVKNVAQWFSDLNPKTQESIVKMAGLAAAVGPVLLIGGKMATGLGSIIGLFGKFSGAATVATGATNAVAGGIGLAGAKASAGALLLNPWTIGLAAAGLTALELAKYLKEDVVPAVEIFDETISESTKEVVGSFLDMEKEAMISLNSLKFSGAKVTEEMRDEITETTNKMADEVIIELERQKVEGLAQLQELHDKSTTLTEEQKEEQIRIATESYDRQIEQAEFGKARIEEILTEAKEANRGIKESERKEIELILDGMKGDAVRLMSESQEEQETILNNLKANSERLTLEMASEIIKNSLKQKEGVIAEAEGQYSETMKLVEALRKDGTEESRKMADDIEFEAERLKNAQITKAEETHKKVVEEIGKQGKDIVKQLDLDNGEIKSKWQELTSWFKNNPIIREIITQEKSIAASERNDRLNPMGSITGKYAGGTNFAHGGWSLVGEEGPEIVELPRGAKVYSNQDSMNMVQGSDKKVEKTEVHIHVGTLVADEYGLTELERRLSNVRGSEKTRLGEVAW